jgi:hypothetical protein
MVKPMKVSGNPNVFAEAKARKKGGKACASPMGGLAKARMDKPRRARGGKVGSDKNPFSSAHKGS